MKKNAFGMESKPKPRGYYDEAYPFIPTRSVKFWRKFVLWQLIRFVVINYKVMKIVAYGHS